MLGIISTTKRLEIFILLQFNPIHFEQTDTGSIHDKEKKKLHMKNPPTMLCRHMYKNDRNEKKNKKPQA